MPIATCGHTQPVCSPDGSFLQTASWEVWGRDFTPMENGTEQWSDPFAVTQGMLKMESTHRRVWGYPGYPVSGGVAPLTTVMECTRLRPSRPSGLRRYLQRGSPAKSPRSSPIHTTSSPRAVRAHPPTKPVQRVVVAADQKSPTKEHVNADFMAATAASAKSRACFMTRSTTTLKLSVAIVRLVRSLSTALIVVSTDEASASMVRTFASRISTRSIVLSIWPVMPLFKSTISFFACIIRA
mmetsp:Transcript_150819/g.263600  ORF Transcript_150819/g.263600 Transcript_150819/m.263600 type:complete len:240 (+) Transcript_150819:796-1515(+)